MADGLTVVEELLSVLTQQQKKEELVMDNLNELRRELNDQETRRYNTAMFRWESTAAEMVEVECLRNALVCSRRELMFNTATERTIRKLKAALQVEDANRDELDQLSTLSPHEQRRGRRRRSVRIMWNGSCSAASHRRPFRASRHEQF